MPERLPENAASRLLEKVRAADPLASSWGLYLAPASGNGDGDGLLWFDSAADLLAFVARDLWPALLGSGPEPELAADLAALLGAGAPLSWGLLEQANLRLEPAAQIHWWGNLRQLYEGEDPFARDLREAWRQGVGRGPQDFSALAPADQAAFAAFLRAVFN